MIRILRDELSALADEGLGRMASADSLAEGMGARFARARRRRPVIIAGTTCLVLATAGAAAAGVSLLRVEVTDLPDRLTAGAVSPAQPTGLRCGREIGEVQPSVLPMTLMADVPENVRASTYDPAPSSSGVWQPTLTANNMTTKDVDVTMGDVAGLYLVEDGVIVAQPRTVGSTADQTLPAGQGTPVYADRPVLCAGGEAPDGTYEAYGSIEVTVHGGEAAWTYDIVGGPWTVELGPPVPVPAAVVRPGIPGLTSLDPAASSVLQCGAEIGPVQVGPSVWADGSDDRTADRSVGWASADDPAARPVDAGGRSTIALRPRILGGTATGYPTTAPALVIVTDGVVVGTSTPDGPSGLPATTPADLDTQAAAIGSVLYRACAGSEPDAGPLPAGRYSVWATQTYHLTERASVPSTGGALVSRVVDEEVEAYGRVADLWIGADGLPVAGPGPAAGWTAAIPQDVAVAGTGEELSVVWFAPAVGGDLSEWISRDVDQEMLAEAGYSSTEMPVACQPRAHAVLNLPTTSTDATGVGVVFATRAEADAFVARFTTGGTGTVVEGEMSCDLS